MYNKLWNKKTPNTLGSLCTKTAPYWQKTVKWSNLSSKNTEAQRSGKHIVYLSVFYEQNRFGEASRRMHNTWLVIAQRSLRKTPVTRMPYTANNKGRMHSQDGYSYRKVFYHIPRVRLKYRFPLWTLWAYMSAPFYGKLHVYICERLNTEPLQRRQSFVVKGPSLHNLWHT